MRIETLDPFYQIDVDSSCIRREGRMRIETLDPFYQIDVDSSCIRREGRMRIETCVAAPGPSVPLAVASGEKAG